MWVEKKNIYISHSFSQYFSLLVSSLSLSQIMLNVIVTTLFRTVSYHVNISRDQGQRCMIDSHMHITSEVTCLVSITRPQDKRYSVDVGFFFLLLLILVLVQFQWFGVLSKSILFIIICIPINTRLCVREKGGGLLYIYLI